MKKLTFISLILISVLIFSCHSKVTQNKINRFELVNRHNILVEEFDSLSSLSVGNGEFAFTTDLTGLQTFYKDYDPGVPLGTQSNWGWNNFPNTGNYKMEECYCYFEVEGRQVPYLHQYGGNSRKAQASEYFRSSPHRIHLGMIRLVLKKADGSVAEITDIQNPKHRLNLWEGRISSEFEVEGVPVKVTTFCHQEKDLVSAKIESPLIAKGQLAVEWDFPYASRVKVHPGYDFSQPEKHESKITDLAEKRVVISRKLDTAEYVTEIQWQQTGEFKEVAKHTFQLVPDGSETTLEFSCLFSPEPEKADLPDFAQTEATNIAEWKRFWESGGAVDFSACKDPRAKELERRTVLSQYLIKIQSTGDLPPAETGLTFNSWYGKHHLEMHWWHSVHQALWNRPEYLENQLDYYEHVFENAKKTAEMQGYKGVRWQKMTDPDGRESPSNVGVYLVWQQPHPIYYAELMYRNNPTPETLEKFKKIVFATADFMADFAQYDTEKDIYNLNPPLIPAQEHWARETTTNPPFELAYWHWGLATALKWQERLGLTANPDWQDVANKLAAPFVFDGVYQGRGNSTDSYTNPEKMRDHPVVLGAYGILPLWDKIDPEIMRATMDTILQKWNWDATWGWDYPMTAMTAIRLLEPEKALEALLKDVQKNTYLVSGHNYQDGRLRLYLPGNGGFLSTIALMCAGWEGCTVENPGFPKDSNWDVRWENLSPML